MTNNDLKVGARVRLRNKIGGRYPGAMYEIAPGPVGTIIAVHQKTPDDDGSQHIAEVRFDAPIEDLSEWDNVLHVFLVEDHSDCSLDDFEIIET